MRRPALQRLQPSDDGNAADGAVRSKAQVGTLRDHERGALAEPRDLAAKFIATVWGAQSCTDPSQERFGFLSSKDFSTGAWTDRPMSPAPTLQIDPPLLADTDLYFAPVLFANPNRQRRHALPSRWLYADLDAVNPSSLPTPLCPTLAYETSQGHFQALWLLDRPLPTRAFERLNQRLTYAIDADKGGWSATKVLRVPGALSHKYKTPFRVRIVPIARPRKHRVHELQALLPQLDDHNPQSPRSTLPPSSALPTPTEVLRTHRKRLSPQLRAALSTKTLVKGDDRSARLWDLEVALLTAGIPPADVYALCAPTIWNKYKGQRRERAALWAEILKAQRSINTDQTPPSTELPPANNKRKKTKPPKTHDWEIIPISDFRHRMFKAPEWLIRGLWTSGVFGFLAGEPKTYKSLFALDLAISVASGTPFLNHFKIPPAGTGPVVLFQEENSPSLVQNRVERIEFQRGLGPYSTGQTIHFGKNYPLHICNHPQLDLADKTDLQHLVSVIQKYKARFVVLDPLYMMTAGLDENAAAEMTPVMRNLIKIQSETKASIQVIHHYSKPTRDNAKSRPMNRMSGSGVIGRSFGSSVFTEVLSEDESKPVIKLSAMHREQHAIDNTYRVEFNMPEDEPLVYNVDVRPWTKADETQTQLNFDADNTDLILNGGRSTSASRLLTSEKQVRAAGIPIPPIHTPTPLHKLAAELNVKSSVLQRILEKRGRNIISHGKALNSMNQRRVIVGADDNRKREDPNAF